MTFTAFALVFASVFLHVAWNFISKRGRPTIAFYSVMSFTAAVLWLPCFILADFPFGGLPWWFFLLVLLSVAGEVTYIAGLSNGYRRGDISLVYPVVRALPVIMVAAVTTLLGLGGRITGVEFFGMAVITVGCLLMPLSGFGDFGRRWSCDKVVGFILMGAVGTTCYTVADSGAIRAVNQAAGGGGALNVLAYLFMIELGLAICLAVLALSSAEGRGDYRRLRHGMAAPLIAGFCSSGAYALILAAMSFVTNVAYVQAFRQMSLPLGFAVGVWLLKEPVNRMKVSGLICIVAGLLITVL